MICDRYQNHVTLREPYFRGELLLQRIPKFLRFTASQNEPQDGFHETKWDALDQLDDQPKPDETIIVGVLSNQSRVHIDRVDKKTRRRIGEWINMVEYHVHPTPPPEDVLRDTAKWQAWCLEQAEPKGSL